MIKFKRLKGSDSNYLLIFKGKKVGGVKLTHCVYGIMLGSVHIRKNYRGRGFGDLLMKFALDKARFIKEESIKVSGPDYTPPDKVFLDVKKRNYRAINLYCKYGFQISYDTAIASIPSRQLAKKKTVTMPELWQMERPL